MTDPFINPAGMTYERAMEIMQEVDARVVRRATPDHDPVSDQVAELHAQGLFDEAIANKLGISRSQVRARRHKRKLLSHQAPGRRPGYRPPSEVDAMEPEIRRLNAEGLTDVAIARRLDATPRAIGDRRRSMKLPNRFAVGSRITQPMKEATP